MLAIMVKVAALVAVAVALPLLLGLPQPVPDVRPGPPAQASGVSASNNFDLRTVPRGGDQPPPLSPPPSPPGVDCDQVKCVAITFDDGPVKQTATVLDALGSRGARATFFVLGAQAAAHPGLLRRMIAEGHAVGNHSWNHPILFGMSSASISNQFRRTQKTITAAIGPHQLLVRTPFGQQNKRIRKLLGRFGAPVILWNVDPQDWKFRNTKTVIRKVVKATRRNSIVLMHDVRPTTRAAVALIVEKLQAKGYVLVTIPELLGSHAKPGKLYLHG
jgi:peptidoglycan/xylan/chitin deacetylase (PgdA/CDA1 family)